MKINTSRKAGFTLVEIMIVVAIIGLLAAIAIPNFIKARTTSQKNACINNLRQIDGAIQQWALENSKAADADVVPEALAVYLGRGAQGAALNDDIKCPAGGEYEVTDVSAAPTCTLGSSDGHTLTAAAAGGGAS
jgi:prepilin-type N-terminal cleavage/methylation domain-containing protein